MEQPNPKTPNKKNPKQVLVAGVFYVFIATTVVAFLFHLFGLNWFHANAKIPEPSAVVQKIIKGLLKAIELVFVYKRLSRKSFVFCFCCAAIQTIVVGFIPAGMYQSIADAALMLVIPLFTRKDRGWAIVDFLFLYALMTLYGLLLTVAKFGGLALDYGYSFYASVLGILDYKLFVITLYLYTRYKGGIKLWMKKRRLLG